jgi:hypothetical protein
MRFDPDDHSAIAGERRERVVWSEHGRTCELWIVKGNGCLRLFDGEAMVTEEPLLEGALWAQALALRTWRPGRRQRYQFGIREGLRTPGGL